MRSSSLSNPLLPDAVAARFNYAAKSYEGAAVMQKLAAERFDAWLAENNKALNDTNISNGTTLALPSYQANNQHQWQAGLSPRRIAEIGCGTGFLTRCLQRRYGQAHMHITDLAPTMLAYCRDSLPTAPQLSFAIADARNVRFSPTPDWIVSTMCFQWLDDLPRVLKWHAEQCRVLAFSVLLDSSFSTWQQAHQAQNLPLGLRSLPGWQWLSELIDKLPTTKTASARFTLTEQYSDGLHFLRTLKKIGASHPRQGYDPINLRPILKNFTDGLTANYDIGFFWIEI